MNIQDLRTTLQEGADALDVGRPERLDEVLGRVHVRRRQRAALATCVVVALVLSVLGTAALVRGSDQAAPPVRPPTPTDVVRTDPAPVRPVVYLEGPFGRRAGRQPTLHYGDRVVDPGVPFGWTDSTDDGLVLSGEDGRIWFWSPETASAEQVGTLGFRPRTYRASGLVRSDTAGSLVAWFDVSALTAPVLMVYDTSRSQFVARHSVPACRDVCSTEAVVGGHVYWADHAIAYGVPDLRQVTVFDVSTGADTPAGRREYEEDLRTRPRALVLRAASGAEEVVAGPGLSFQVAAGRLVPATEGTRPPVIEVPADSGSGPVVELRPPARYEDGAAFTFVQWLDDDRFAVIGGGRAEGQEPGQGRDILSCSLTIGQCSVAARGQGHLLAPGIPLAF